MEIDVSPAQSAFSPITPILEAHMNIYQSFLANVRVAIAELGTEGILPADLDTVSYTHLTLPTKRIV